MTIIYEAIKGMIFISIFALFSHGCSIEKMARRALDANRKQISYQDYSQSLTRYSPQEGVKAK